MTVLTPTAPTELPEVVVNDMGPLGHVFPGDRFGPGPVAYCGARFDLSRPAERYRPGDGKRTCAECERISAERRAARGAKR